MKKTFLMLAVALLCGGVVSAQSQLRQGELSNIRKLTSDSDLKYENPQWSPDGSKVAFTKLGYDGLYVINADGSQKQQLSDASGVGYMLQWGADSKEILVRDTRWELKDGAMERSHAAWAIDLKGAKIRMSEDAAEMQPAAWRYDALGNKSIVTDKKVLKAQGLTTVSLDALRKFNPPASLYNISFITDCDHLFAVDAKGNKTMIYEGEAFHPALSPNGKLVTFVNMFDEIIIMNLDGSNARKVAKGFSPSWIDNDHIIYERTIDNGHIYLSGDLFMLNINANAEIQLTNTPTRIEMNPSVSPDGKKVVFTDFYDGQLYIADFK